jgi:outer membrane protein OmpA-like peptidoglycan-associated protein
MRVVVCLLVSVLVFSGAVFAQERMPVNQVCGPAPEEVSQSEKGNLDAKAQTLLKIGSGELQGTAEKFKNEIMVNPNRSDAARQLFYLKRISCVLIYQDTTLSTDEKLERIEKLERGISLPNTAPPVDTIPKTQGGPSPSGQRTNANPSYVSHSKPPLIWNTRPYLIFFDWQKDNVTPEGYNILYLVVDEYYKLEKSGDSFWFWVTGYASPGCEEDMATSEQRAITVRDILIELGIPPGRLRAAARGSSDPRVVVPASVCEPQNRRVEIFAEVR